MQRFGAFYFALLIRWTASFTPLPIAQRSMVAPPVSSPSALYIFERISEEGISGLVSAQSAAAKYQLETVTIPCLLQGLVQFPETAAVQRTLQRYRITLRRVETAVAAVYIGTDDRSQGWLAGFRSASEGEDRPFSGPVQAALTRAGKLADVAESTVVSSHHVLLAVLEVDPQQLQKDKQRLNVTNESEGWTFLQSLGVMDVNVTATDFCTTLLETLAGNGPELVTGVAAGSNNSPTLDTVGVDLTQQARDGLLDPVYGRDSEIKSCIRTLLRRRKNCVCLIGDAGVGKTAIAEGVAQALVAAGSESPLRDHRLISIELASLVAGTRYRGDFEERLQSIVKEVTDPATPPTILFLDEIHNLVGAGATEGGMDAANLLKPALARGQLQLIGATTIAEYRKYIEKDAALERRLQPVFVKEPSVPATLDILTAVQPNYEQHHKVKYTAAALDSAAALSERYINDRFLPDKALDLLDEAGALVVLQAMEQNDDNVEVDSESGVPLVTAETIAAVLSEFTGIPLGQLQTKELDRLQQLEEDMERRVKGQPRAVRGVARAIRRARSGLRDPRRPVASFLFCGPTGTGKTELCKTLAETYYGSEKDMIRIDMSEYMEKFSASRLTGPPPGYVGYEEGGQLTEAVRRASHSCILLDEIEKAHEDVLNVLLQVMEDGVLTDGKGRTVNFKNCVIVMTSNIGSRRILDFFRSGSKQSSSPAVAPAVVETTPPMVSNGQSAATLVEDEPKPMEPAEILQRMQNNPKVGNLLMKASTDPAIMEAIRTAMSGSPADLQRAAQENPDIAAFLQELWGELDDEEAKAAKPSSGLSALRGSLEDTMSQWDASDASRFVEGVAQQMDPKHRYGELSDIVKEELEAAMKPELLNRIDDIVVFSPLSKPDLYAIAQRNIGIITTRAQEEHGLEVEIEQDLLDKVVEEGSANAEEFGARPMRRAAQRYIEDTLSEAIIGGFAGKNAKVSLSLAESDSLAGNDSVRIFSVGDSHEIEVEGASGGIGSKSAQQRSTSGIESAQVEMS